MDNYMNGNGMSTPIGRGDLPKNNDVDFDGVSNYYEDKGRYDSNKRNENKLLLPFMVPFYFLSEKASIYYHVYKYYTSALEKIFKERVFTDNSPITGVTEAKIDEFEFHATKRYQKGALIVLILTVFLTFISILTPHIFSIISTFLLMYIFLASFYVDLYLPAKKYTYASKKFADEGIEITQNFYNNYIKNFHLTEKVYSAAIISSWIIVFFTIIFKDTIEYTFIFDSGILTSFSWYFFLLMLVIPTSALLFYHYEKEKIKNSADIQREKLIEEILNTTKTNFDIARQKLRDYR
jgi:hypothetical protein